MQRNRLVYLVLIVLVIGVGLASRSRLGDYVPEFIGTYAGDALWALMIYLVLGLIFSGLRTPLVAVVAMAIAFTVEISQLYQADWMNWIRATRPGALVLGAGFLWSDLICYTTGVLVGVAGEGLWFQFGAKRRVGGPGR